MGSDIQSVRQFRALRVDGMLDRIPAGQRYYVTIDIGRFGPSIAPGTGTPSWRFCITRCWNFSTELTKRGSIAQVVLSRWRQDMTRPAAPRRLPRSCSST